MRPLASSLGFWLLATLLAIAAVVALAMGWLAVRPAPLGRSTLPAPTTSRPTEAELPMPAALLPLREGSRAVEASVRRANPPQLAGAVLATVTMAKAGRATGVLGVLEGETGVILRTARLEGDASVLLSGVPAGAHWLCLADDERELRYGYRARTKVVVEAGRDVTASLEGDVHEVSLLLAAEPDAALAERTLRVTRSDDPRWLCATQKLTLVKGTPATTGSAPTRARVQVRGLGRGVYGVRVRPEGPEVAVTIPGPSEIEAGR